MSVHDWRVHERRQTFGFQTLLHRGHQPVARDCPGNGIPAANKRHLLAWSSLSVRDFHRREGASRNPRRNVRRSVRNVAAGDLKERHFQCLDLRSSGASPLHYARSTVPCRHPFSNTSSTAVVWQLIGSLADLNTCRQASIETNRRSSVSRRERSAALRDGRPAAESGSRPHRLSGPSRLADVRRHRERRI